MKYTRSGDNATRRVLNESAICEYLEWDSEFFGYRIARVLGSRISSRRARRIDAWCTDNQIECLYFLAVPTDIETARTATRYGFTLVDVRLTFAMNSLMNTQFAAISDGVRIRTPREEDMPALRRIARASCTVSRFFFDDHFEGDAAERLYDTWITKSCKGFAEHVFIAELAEAPVGYITCHVDSVEHKGRIGLVGVDEMTRGRSIGTSLTLAALGWFRDQRVESVEVITQGRNIQAQRLYQRCDFRTQSLELWFHKWYQAE